MFEYKIWIFGKGSKRWEFKIRNYYEKYVMDRLASIGSSRKRE